MVSGINDVPVIQSISCDASEQTFLAPHLDDMHECSELVGSGQIDNMWVNAGRKVRPFEDGGGIPSQGKLVAHKRSIPQFAICLRKCLDEISINYGIAKLLVRVADGCSACPLPDSTIIAARSSLSALLVSQGVGNFDPALNCTRGGPSANFCLGLWEGILRGLNDPDLDQLDFLWNGCDAGFDAPLPRTSIFRAAPTQDGQPAPEMDHDSVPGNNYSSVHMYERLAWEKIHARLQKQWIAGPFSFGTLRERFGKKLFLG